MEEKVVEQVQSALIDPKCPKELKSLIGLTAMVAEDYRKAVNEGVKKRATEARKSLGEIKKLAHEMRKMALEAKKADS
jgi:DNA anti-recombination protein RmuC